MSAPLYRVEWPDHVLESDIASILLTLRLAGHPTQAVYEDMNRIDRRLESRASDEGESREGNTRMLFEGCLCVTFHVDEARKSVEVVKATYNQRRR